MDDEVADIQASGEILFYGQIDRLSVCARNRIPAQKTRREWRFDATELDKWLKSCKLTLPEGRRF